MLPALETLLARAEPLTQAVSPSFETTIFALFGIGTAENQDLPVAAITRVLDMGVIDKGWWLRADPVHLHPDRDRLILTDGRMLDITQDEANRLAAEIMEVYAADGWLLKAPRPDRWYLKPRRAPKITTTPLAEVINRDIHPCLPQGEDGMAWHGVLNEIQILLHTANANMERERQGKLPVNSLWFWGGGELPRMKPVQWAQVWSEEPVSLALARLSEITTSGVPDSFAAWQRQTQKSGEHLVVLDRARGAMQYGDLEEWAGFMEKLERDWMMPLLDALKDQTLAGLTLYSDTGKGYCLTSRHARRWWRRCRPLFRYY